jgi:hypothetical protein
VSSTQLCRLMGTNRRHADKITAAIQAMQNAAAPDLLPPAQCKLRDGDGPFWQGIIRARARDQWTENDLVVAAQLARCQADIEREQQQLDAESAVVENGRGTKVMNARVTVLEQLSRRELALMRILRLGGYTAGKSSDEHGLARVERAARRAREEISEYDEDSLLAS